MVSFARSSLINKTGRLDSSGTSHNRVLLSPVAKPTDNRARASSGTGNNPTDAMGALNVGLRSKVELVSELVSEEFKELAVHFSSCS